jgi:hypothetical protein
MAYWQCDDYSSDINRVQGSAAIWNLSWRLDKMIMKKANLMTIIIIIVIINIYTLHTLLTEDLRTRRTVFRLLRTMDSYLVIWSVYVMDNQLVTYSAS